MICDDDPSCQNCHQPAAYSALDPTGLCDECRAKRGLPRRGVKHGPGGRGTAGPCDPSCPKCAAATPPSAPDLSPLRPDGFSPSHIDEIKRQLTSPSPRAREEPVNSRVRDLEEPRSRTL